MLEDAALVIWEWKFMDGTELDYGSDDEDSLDEDVTVIPETPPPYASDEEEKAEDKTENSGEENENANAESDSILPVTHTVTFKCIGCTKENAYQEILKCIAQMQHRGEDVPCKIQPEPENPIDSEAIAFKCKLDDQWHTIGYVVKEVLKEVHEALAQNKVTNVSIDWVKFVIYWKTPGWFAGIKITKIGEWSRTVVMSQSARMHT